MKKGIAILLLGLAGCGTINDFSGNAPLDGPAPHVYGGLRNDLAYAKMTGCKAVAGLIFVPDIPFSALLDTALLPITGVIALIRGTP